MKQSKQIKAGERADDFSPRILNVVEHPPAPLPGLILRLVTLFMFSLLVWAAFGELDIVARAEGKLIPQTRLKVVQPFEGGRIEKILVHEGQQVKKDQSLLIMDTHLSQSDTQKIVAELNIARLQLRRIDAELSISPLERQESDDKESFDAVLAQFQSHQQTYQSAMAEQQAALKQAQRQLEAERVILKKLEEILPIQKETEATYIKLGKEGYAAKQLVLEKRQSRIEVEKNLKSQEFVIQSLKAKIQEANEKIHSITATYQQNLYDERAAIRQQLSQLEQEHDKQKYRNTLMELKAPQDGVVIELATHTEGTVIPTGSVVMRLVPLNDPLKAEVYVSNQDIGFIDVGQTVRVKLASYKFQKYGMIDAKVEQISADAIEPKDNGDQAHALTYKTLLILDKQQLERDGHVFSLRSGMYVTAEIKLGKRSVLEYLLSPIQKTVSEAGTER